MEDLRMAKNGDQLPWTLEQIKAGFIRHNDIHGRFPTAHEVDAFEYLPSARSFQRSFGGLVKIRQELFPEQIANFTTGEVRGNKARQADARARLYEEEFHTFLIEHFQPISIHEHKIVRPGNVACDFFIYIDDSRGIVIDLFYAQDIRTLAKIVHIKLKRYATIPFETYFILVGNDAISDKQIDVRMNNRLISLPDHIHVSNEHIFKDLLLKNIKKRSLFVLP